MPLVIPPGFAQVSLQFDHDLDPDPWFVTYGIEYELGTFEAEDLAARHGVCWSTAGPMNSMSSAIHLTEVSLALGQDGGPPLIINYPLNVAGSATADMLPQNCALLVAKQSALAGRRGKGRIFVPGVLNESNVNAVGQLGAGNRDAFQTVFNAWLTEVNDTTAVPGLESTMVLLHSTGISAIPDPTPVTALVVDLTISTQRRRLR